MIGESSSACSGGACDTIEIVASAATVRRVGDARDVADGVLTMT